MRRLILIFTIWTLVQAKPEMYREKEDFAFSRSSSDEGHKSGYYGAQRGNMGGNFEKSHNMDTLAQHQMSGLVRQVEGELGDSSKAREGNVFTSANSRGIYGSGTYDLSNLEGRNFGEGTTYYDSQFQNGQSGHSSHSSQSMSHSSQRSDRRYGSSGNGGYEYRGQAGQGFQTDDQQSLDLSSGQYAYGSEASRSRYSQSGRSDQSHYRGSSDSQLSSDQTHLRGISESQLTGSDYRSSDQLRSRLTSGPHSSIIIRPGTRVTVPVAVHSSSYDQRADAETLSNSDHRAGYTSSGNPKYYESSSSYRKEWEKHDSEPVVPVPLAVPSMPTQGELYDTAQVAQISDKQFEGSGIDSQSSHGYSGYNANAQISTSSQSRHQSDYSSQRQGTSGFHVDGSSGSVGRSGNLVGEVTSKPKSYQSSYSYHKAWERQGDPYVIIPNTKGADDSASQRLTSAYDQSYGSQSRQSSTGYSHGCSIQCDERSHLRVSRSVDYNEEPYQSQSFDIGQEEMGQQVQTAWGNVEDLGQQIQSEWDQLQDFGQQSQSKWVFPFGQQPQTEDELTNFEQQSEAKTDNLEDFGQQVQSSWDKEETPVQKSKISDDLAQNTQQQIEITKQQTEQKENLEDLGQNVQSATEKREKFGVQFSDKNDKTDYFDQQVVDSPEGNLQWQQTQDEWHDLQNSGQQTQNSWVQSSDIGQQSQQTWDKNTPAQAVDLKDYSQQTQEASLHQTESISNPVKPVWEQSQDDTVTIKSITEPKISSVGKVYHWENVHGHNFQQTEHSSHVNYSSHSNSSSSQQNTHQQEVSHSRDMHTQSNSHALHDLWGMIENFEKESSKPKDHSHFPALEGQSTASKIDFSDIVPSHESGRGDISDLDETSLSVTSEKTIPAQDKHISQVHVPKSENDYKTPQEIESLSLKENITASNNINLQNSETGRQKSDTTLSVLSIQDWLNQEKQHESSLQYEPLKPIINIETNHRPPGQKPHTQESQEKLLEQAPEDIQQSEIAFDEGKKIESLDQQVQSTWSNPEGIQKPNQTTWEKWMDRWSKSDDLGQVQSNLGKLEDLGQKTDTPLQSSEDFGQQVQSNWGKSEDLGQKELTAGGSSEDFGQQVQSNWGQLEDLGQKAQTAQGSSEAFGQQVQSNWGISEDLGQKTQTSWGNSDDFGQQLQTSWQPSDTFQRSETQQQMQDFGSHNINSDHAPNFYEQNYPKNYRTPVNEGVETHKVEDLQVPHHLDTAVPTTEAMTEKPGFWKGVGNKLSNAKETVYSWFRRS